MSGIVTATQQKAVHHSISGRVQPPIERERARRIRPYPEGEADSATLWD
jgi:hypothetical protein